MLMDSHISIKFLFSNSPPLPVFSAELYFYIQDLKIALIITSGSLDGITVDVIVELCDERGVKGFFSYKTLNP